MLQFVADVEAADCDHRGETRGRQGADDNATDQHGPKEQEQGAIVRLSKHAIVHWRSLPFSVGESCGLNSAPIADDGREGSKLKRGVVMADIDRHELHTLVDHIPESDVPAARKVLRALADPVELAILAAPLDDEPETEGERASVASSLADASSDIPFEKLRRKRA
jgi:hypothetical protein